MNEIEVHYMKQIRRRIQNSFRGNEMALREIKTFFITEKMLIPMG